MEKPTDTETAPSAATARLTTIVDASLAERVRNAVDYLQGPPLRLRLASFLEAAVLIAVEKLEKEHNKGKPFPQRPGKLPR